MNVSTTVSPGTGWLENRAVHLIPMLGHHRSVDLTLELHHECVNHSVTRNWLTWKQSCSLDPNAWSSQVCRLDHWASSWLCRLDRRVSPGTCQPEDNTVSWVCSLDHCVQSSQVCRLYCSGWLGVKHSYLLTTELHHECVDMASLWMHRLKDNLIWCIFVCMCVCVCLSLSLSRSLSLSIPPSLPPSPLSAHTHTLHTCALASSGWQSPQPVCVLWMAALYVWIVLYHHYYYYIPTFHPFVKLVLYCVWIKDFMCEKSFKMCVCLWLSLIILRWPYVVDRMLKSNYWQANIASYVLCM